jgi:hypothetical protein
MEVSAGALASEAGTGPDTPLPAKLRVVSPGRLLQMLPSLGMLPVSLKPDRSLQAAVGEGGGQHGEVRDVMLSLYV